MTIEHSNISTFRVEQWRKGGPVGQMVWAWRPAGWNSYATVEEAKARISALQAKPDTAHIYGGYRIVHVVERIERHTTIIYEATREKELEQ